MLAYRLVRIFHEFLHHDWDLSENINLVGGSQMKVQLRYVFGVSIFLEITKPPLKNRLFFTSQGKGSSSKHHFSGANCLF